ncbi:MAG: YIP1 family protein [Acidobacteria bacterium]|nr:YIP1 family protein [Acidobacteriota bacterium]
MNPELSYASQSENVTPEPRPQNFFNRLIGVWFSPGETFAEIGRAPRVLVPMIVLMVMGCVMGYLMIERIGVRNFFNAQFEQAVASGRMSQEDADKQLDAMTTGTVAAFTKYSFPLVGLIQYPAMALFLVGICKLITMLIGGDNQFKPLFSVTLYTLLAVSVISSVLLLVLLYLKSPEEIDVNNLIGSNVAALLSLAFGKDGLPKFVMAFARWIDLFSIWMITLLAIGYAAVSKKVKASTMGIALGCIYVLVALIAAGWAAMRG